MRMDCAFPGPRNANLMSPQSEEPACVGEVGTGRQSHCGGRAGTLLTGERRSAMHTALGVPGAHVRPPHAHAPFPQGWPGQAARA
jgi:hypothetical protein